MCPVCCRANGKIWSLSKMNQSAHLAENGKPRMPYRYPGGKENLMKEKMGRTLIIGSAKGGVAKTCGAYNLAYSLAAMGKKVLCCDLDPQANLTTCFGVEDTAAIPATLGHLMMMQMDEEEMPDKSEYIMERNGVDFIPSSMMLSVVEAKLRLELGAERILTGILEPLKEDYDWIILDTPPSMSTLTINALAAADQVIASVNAQLLAMCGLHDFLKTVKKIKNRINPKIQMMGILLSMCETRRNLYKVISEELTGTFEGQIKVFESRIPYTVKVGESVYYSQPLLEYAPNCNACEAYMNLAKEVVAYEG